MVIILLIGLMVRIELFITELELQQLPDLCKLLENVCTARDFLLEVGGEGDKSLADFMVIRTVTENTTG